MDPILVARRLPQVAARAMRGAIVDALARNRLTPRTLIDDALLRFERSIGSSRSDIRPALLFGERERIVRELRAFIDSRLAARLAALRRGEVVALGNRAAPFDLLIRNRRGRAYAVVLRRLPRDDASLEVLRRIARVAERYEKTPLCGVLVYDFSSGRARLIGAISAIGRAAA